MFVVCYFNLRLGWVLSGLVVPGYLVPLLLIKPWSGSVVLLEGFVTYFLVWLFSEYLSRHGPWGNLFGRDRFFALVLCSIIVRLVFDGFLLPSFGAWANEYWNISFDYRNNLHSFGLIIVALIANQFWKTGFVKGLIPLTVTLGLTLLIVRYGLMELTNFSLSNISYLYEDMASSILATPKAYIILISTAFLASRMNLHYGWDFNGILIPSLLALQWYQPVKILATIVEAGIILMLASLLLKTAWLSKMTIEGARKLLLFFNVSFAYKFILGYVLIIWFPAIKVTDYYGFGYLLSTLMAVKIHDKAILARLTRATLQTSLTAVAFATVLGFGLTLLPISSWFTAAKTPAVLTSKSTLQQIDQPLPELLKQELIRMYQTKVNDTFVLPLASELDDFSSAISLIKRYLKSADADILQQASQHLAEANYQLTWLHDRYIYLHEKTPLHGWGAYIIDTQAKGTLALSVPAALDETNVLDASISLFTSLGAQSLAITGSSRYARIDTKSDVLNSRQTFFHVYHSLFARHDSLQIRGYTAQTARQVSGLRQSETELAIKGLTTTLWVTKQLPDSLNLVQLKTLLDHFEIDWNTAPFSNLQRDVSGHGFAELMLTQQDVRKLLFRPLLLQSQVTVLEQDISIEGYLQDWVLTRKEQIASKGTELYVQPKQEELLFFDEQILTPLLAIEQHYVQENNVWSEQTLDELRAIDRAARIMGYQLMRYRHRKSQQEYLILSERDDIQPRYWGTYVLRLGQHNPYMVEVARPLYEVNSFEYGVSLFERIKAKYLLIGATHPYANADGSADLIGLENKVSLFNLFNQVALRELHDAEMMVVSARAFAYRIDQQPPDADVLFADTNGVVLRQHLNRLETGLINTIEADGMTVKLVDGGPETLGYEVGSTAQALYLSATVNKSLAVLWLSPDARMTYRQQNDNKWQIAQFAALNIEMFDTDLESYLTIQSLNKTAKPDAKFIAEVTAYVENPNVMRLQLISQLAQQYKYSIQRVLDPSSKQAFLVIHNNNNELLAVANLLPRLHSMTHLDVHQHIDKQVMEYINQRQLWLLVAD